MTPLPDPPPAAHDEIARLTRENEALRAQLAARADVVHVQGDPSRGSAAGHPTRLPTPTRTRRWIGRAIAAAMLAAGFGLGAWYAGGARDEITRGVRDGRATRDAMDAPTIVPADAPPPRAAPRTLAP
jgi:hypothetical protein